MSQRAFKGNFGRLEGGVRAKNAIKGNNISE